MQYLLTHDFTAISETSGVFYARPVDKVEIAVGNAPLEYTGFILQGGIPLRFDGENIKARSVSAYKRAVLNVTPTADDSGGGGDDVDFATDEEVEEMLDNVFG